VSLRSIFHNNQDDKAEINIPVGIQRNAGRFWVMKWVALNAMVINPLAWPAWGARSRALGLSIQPAPLPIT